VARLSRCRFLPTVIDYFMMAGDDFALIVEAMGEDNG
jgi:hypothetical protein